jgi:O-antigen/teichoic acid export membrane protein
MSVIRRNVIANFAGKAWAVLMSLAFVPVYIKLLGIEAYGLIGFFLTLVAILSLLDLGLGTTLNRRLAQLSIEKNAAQEMCDLLRTLELIYLIIGIVIGATIAALAPFIANHWIKSEQLPVATVTHAVAMMGVAIACHWPLALYSGGLMGLQKQVVSNTITSLIATVRNFGAVVVIWQVSSTIEAFFAWQLAVSLAETVLTRFLLRRYLPIAPQSPRFRVRLLNDLWRFAAGITGISLLSVILTQLDKVILSKVLSLEAFAYYNLAWRLASGLYYLVSPINTAFFPRFAQLAAVDDKDELARLYHRGCQLTSVVVIPVTVVLAMFSAEFLALWIRDPQITARTSNLLTLLVIGTALNGLMNLPLTLQLAYGWTRLVFVMNVAAVCLLAPMIYVMSLRFGGEGAACIWIVLNAGYVVFMLQIMHRRLLPGHLRDWFIVDVGLPLVAAVTVATICRQMINMSSPDGWLVLKLTAVSLLTAMASALAAPQVRSMILHTFDNHSVSRT